MSNISMPQPVRRHVMLLLTIPVMALLIVGIVFGWDTWHSESATMHGSIPTNPQLETTWGVRITQIGVTADGGLVDFRYQVLDPDKAAAMSEDLGSVPVLTDERSGTLVNSAALMPHKHDLRPGQTYFFLYRNTNGAIKPGNLVTVRVGGLKLEHVMVQ